MIISHKYKFIFIKTVKTAGSSLELFLHPFCDEKDIVTPFKTTFDSDEKEGLKQNCRYNNKLLNKDLSGCNDKERRVFTRALNRYENNDNSYYEHISAWEVKNAVGEKVWNEYYKFCVVRNPYDRAISFYYFRNNQLGINQSFDDFLDGEVHNLNHPKYTDWINGKIMVDKVVRFERLNEDLAEVFNKLNIPFDGLNIFKKNNIRKKNTSYKDFLNEEQAAKIRKIYSKEFELFDYKF